MKSLFIKTLFGMILILTGCQLPDDQPDARYKAGLKLIEAGEIQKAVLEFRAVLQINNNHVGALYGLSKYLESVRQWRAAQETLQKIIDLEPDNVDARIDLCRLMLLVDALDQALEQCEVAEKHAPKRAVIYALQANVHKRRGDDQSARELANKALELQPNNVDALVLLAFQKSSKGEIDEAEKLLLRALELAPDRVDAIVLLASLREQQGLQDEAVRLYRRAVAQAPGSPLGYRALAVHQMREGETAAALGTIDVGLEVNPADTNLLLIKATALEQTLAYDQAIKTYEELIEHQPRSVTVANNLASLLAEHRTDEESLKRAEELADRLQSLNVPQFKDTLAWVHFKRGRYSPAIKLLLEAVAAPDPMSIYHYHLGQVYRANGDLDRARDQFEAALKLAETSQFAQAEATRQALVEIESVRSQAAQ